MLTHSLLPNSPRLLSVRSKIGATSLHTRRLLRVDDRPPTNKKNMSKEGTSKEKENLGVKVQTHPAPPDSMLDRRLPNKSMMLVRAWRVLSLLVAQAIPEQIDDAGARMAQCFQL